MESESHPESRSRSYYFILLGLMIVMKVLDVPLPGVIPGDPLGWIGIFTAPFRHGDYVHLFSNLLPLILMGWIIHALYGRGLWGALLIIWLSAGGFVYILARESQHIGASGLVYGEAAMLFFTGVFSGRRRYLGISLVIIFLYSGMVAGLLPVDNHISWESHLYGAIGGIGAAWYYRSRLISLPVAELEEDDDGDDDNSISGGPSVKYTYKE